MEVGLGEGAGEEQGSSLPGPVSLIWPLHSPGAEEPRTRLSCGQQTEQGWHPPGFELLYLVESWTLAFGQLPSAEGELSTALGASHTLTRHLLSGPWDWDARVRAESFSSPSQLLFLLTCWSLSACLSPPPRADWFWLASRITIHIFCLHFQPNFPVFSFSCLCYLTRFFSSLPHLRVNPQDW